MSFASLAFLIFFVVTLAGTAHAERCFPRRVKECFLLLASYFFYGWWDWRFCFLLLFVTVSSYFTANFVQYIYNWHSRTAGGAGLFQIL